MCGRFEVLSWEEVAEVAAAVEARRKVAMPHVRPRDYARPGDVAPIIVADGPEALRIGDMRWGFPLGEGGRLAFNTRIETAASSPLWRDAARDGRCVVPAAAFYEPHVSETSRNPRTGRTMKRQYRFATPDGTPLLLAGVQADGKFSVVTCPPNADVAPVHGRMPLALLFHEVEEWFSGDWQSLSDRSGIRLTAAPENIPPSGHGDQLTLF